MGLEKLFQVGRKPGDRVAVAKVPKKEPEAKAIAASDVIEAMAGSEVEDFGESEDGEEE